MIRCSGLSEGMIGTMRPLCVQNAQNTGRLTATVHDLAAEDGECNEEE